MRGNHKSVKNYSITHFQCHARVTIFKDKKLRFLRRRATFLEGKIEKKTQIFIISDALCIKFSGVLSFLIASKDFDLQIKVKFFKQKP